MRWWYENEEEMKSCEHCSHEDCKNIGGTWYCLECPECGVNWKETKMEFDKSRVYTSLNADELKAGDKVIVDYDVAHLKAQVRCRDGCDEIKRINAEDITCRFNVGDGNDYPLAYLVERKENCTNCDGHCEVTAHPELDRCSNWKPKTEQKAEPHYRPFKDIDELIEKWWKLDGWSKAEAKYKNDKLRMPLIWLKNKYNLCHISSLVTGFFDNKVIISGEKIESMEMLYADWVFPDGTPCGVEE